VLDLTGTTKGKGRSVGSTLYGGTYAIEWLTDTKLLVWAPDGYLITDLHHPARSTTAASGETLGLGAPRVSDNTLCLVYTPMAGDLPNPNDNNVVAWTELAS
jgi:hypothetical protein